MNQSNYLEELNKKFYNDDLSNAVRCGRCGSDPRIIPEFIRRKTVNFAEESRELQWQAQEEIVRVLYDTVADTLVASCWRHWCATCCCMPLHTLKCLSMTQPEIDKTHKLEQELRSLKGYYQLKGC